MKNEKRSPLHLLILMASLVIALALRLIRLGALPLSAMEAETALQALAVARNSKTLLGPHIAYVGLTSFDFFIFNAGNFMARFLPGIFGSLIVFVPFLFRAQIGHWPASLLSLVLAISPEMVGLSRVIGSPMIAFVALLLGIGFLLHCKPRLMGVALAVGLMSGAGFWMGGLTLGISFLIFRGLFGAGQLPGLLPVSPKRKFWLQAGFPFLITLLVIGTGFFRAPAGLSGIFLGLSQFIRGFAHPVEAPWVLLPLTLIAYTPAALLLGVWGSLRGVVNRSKVELFLVIWWLVSLLLIILYPSSTPADMIWVALPLWVLSVRVVTAAWRFPQESRLIVAVTAAIVVVLSAFIVLMLRALINPSLEQTQQMNYLIAMVGGVVLLLAIILLVNFGWSEEIALPGLLIGLGIVFSLGLIAGSVNSTGLTPEPGYELWYPEEAILSPEWVQVSLERVMGWNKSGGTPVEIAVSDYDSPVMRWILRDEDPVDFVPYLPPQSQPGILITDISKSPEISNSYRGQSLVWSRDVLWQTMSPFNYLSWLITRDAPTQANKIIFWARTDLMPDGQVLK